MAWVSVKGYCSPQATSCFSYPDLYMAPFLLTLGYALSVKTYFGWLRLTELYFQHDIPLFMKHALTPSKPDTKNGCLNYFINCYLSIKDLCHQFYLPIKLRTPQRWIKDLTGIHREENKMTNTYGTILKLTTYLETRIWGGGCSLAKI